MLLYWNTVNANSQHYWQGLQIHKKGKKTTFLITYKPQILQTNPPSRWYNLCVAYWDFDAAEYTVKFNKIKMRRCEQFELVKQTTQ